MKRSMITSQTGARNPTHHISNCDLEMFMACVAAGFCPRSGFFMRAVQHYAALLAKAFAWQGALFSARRAEARSWLILNLELRKSGIGKGVFPEFQIDPEGDFF